MPQTGQVDVLKGHGFSRAVNTAVSAWVLQAEKNPDLAKRGIRLRKFGQELSERITGKKIHAVGITPGGMVSPLKEEDRQALLNWIPEAMETARIALDIFKKYGCII